MNNNRVCIICRETKDASQFNEEHIIPESIGNRKLKINCVCKKCNERLGTKIDVGLTNNFLTELFRFQDKIKGKSGKIPNPFKKGVDEEGKIIYCDEDLNPRAQPKIKYNKELSKISVASNSIEESIKLVEKKLKRLGKPSLSAEQIEEIYKNSKTIQYKPKIKMSASIDVYKLQMAIVKIAYEFMYYIIGDEYLNDKQGKKISEMLKEYIYNNKTNKLDGLVGIAKNNKQQIVQLNDKLGDLFFENENIHFIFMCKNSQDDSIVQVNLFSILNYAVIVSNRVYDICNRGIILDPKSGEIIEI